MPIGRDEWKKGRAADTPEAMVETFLQKNRGSAFTKAEIARGVFGLKAVDDLRDFIGNFVSIWTVEDAIKTLLSEGRIEAKTVRQRVGTETYYAIP